MAEVDGSVYASGYFQAELPLAKDGLVLWDSLDVLRISRTPEQQVRPLRVLLAEDNPIDQISIRRLLEKQGIEVLLAADGRQAVDIYEEGAFDVVLLDILMPEMDGFEVADYIRRLEQESGSHVPVIALTAYALKAVYDKCRSVGMNGYLSKPIVSSDLRALFAQLLPESAELLQG